MYLTQDHSKTLKVVSWFSRLLIGLFLSAAIPAAAQNVTLAWSPSTNRDVVGYNVYFGSASRNYTNSVDVGNVTSATITGLVSGVTYYFAATTYDAAGNQSPYSSEIVYLVPTSGVTNPPPDITNPPPNIDYSISLPTLDPIADFTVRANTDRHSLLLTGLSPGTNNSGSVRVTAGSSDTGKIAAFSFQSSADGSSGILFFKTAPNITGPVMITVSVSNTNADNNTFSRSFNVTLISPNVFNSNLTPPTFFGRPTNTLAVVGQAVSLKAAAMGSGVLSYAWKFNGQMIPNATNATLTLKKVSATQAGLYTVTVSSPSGSTNAVAKLTILPSAAALLGQPKRNGNGKFTFTVTGIPGYKYVVQTSTDLTHWTSLQTNVSPFVVETTPTSSEAKRFFRANYDSAQ